MYIWVFPGDMVDLGRGFVINVSVYPPTVFGPDFKNRVRARTLFSAPPKFDSKHKEKQI